LKKAILPSMLYLSNTYFIYLLCTCLYCLFFILKALYLFKETGLVNHLSKWYHNSNANAIIFLHKLFSVYLIFENYSSNNY